jgi:hypothetical protein
LLSAGNFACPAKEKTMELIDGLASLAIMCIVICVLCYGLFTALVVIIEFYQVICYPFERLRCLVAGTDDRFAPLGRLFLAELVSKLTAALIVGVIALLLGASNETTAIAAVVAFLFIG